MTMHLHSEFIEGCYRCDLSRDELPGPHECDADEIDSIHCECGVLHAYCMVCGELADVCELEGAL